MGNKTMMVICIDNLKSPLNGGLFITVGETYKVIEEAKEEYLVENDRGSKETWYSKKLFKPLSKQEQNQYTVQEVLEMNKGTILKLFPYDESEKRIIVAEGISENKYLYYIDDEDCHEEGVIISSWIMEKPRFIIVQEQLEHAQDKENRCYNKKCQHSKENICWLKKTKKCERYLKEPINYEEEYSKLKEENLDYTLRLNNQGIRISTDGKQIQKLLKENEELKETIKEGIKSVRECGEALESKNKSIQAFGEAAARDEERIENQKIRMRELTVENEGLQQGIDGCKERIKSHEKEIEQLKKHNNQGYMEQMNITINEKNEEIEDLKEKLQLAKAEESETEWIKSMLTKYETELKQDRENISALKTLINLL